MVNAKDMETAPLLAAGPGAAVVVSYTDEQCPPSQSSTLSSSSHDISATTKTTTTAITTAATTSSSSSDDSDSDEIHIQTTYPPLRTALILLAGNLALILAAIDHTILATLAGPISADIASLSMLPYIAASYSLMLSPSVAVTGRLTDVFGRGPVLALAAVVFGLANLACGLAQHPAVFLFGRALTGFCSGPLCVIPMLINSDLVPPNRRGVINSLLSVSWGTGCVFGGFFGGVISDLFGWRMAFLVQVPLILVVAVLVATLVRIPPKQSRSGKSHLARIDWTGALLVVLGLVLFQAPLNAGGVLVPWSHPFIWTSMALSVVSFAALVSWELRTKYPMVPVDMLANRTVCMASLASFVSTYDFITVTFYIPLFFQVFGMTATEAGSRLLVSAAGQAVGGFAGGWLINKIGYKAVGAVFNSTAVAFIGVLCIVDDTTPKWATWFTVFLIGVGAGPLANATFMGALAAVNDQSKMAAVTTMVQIFREVGATVGVAIPAAVFENVLRSRLWERFGATDPDAGKKIDDILDEVLTGTLPDGWWDGGVRVAFIESFQWVWMATVVVGVAGTAFLCSMRSYRLREDFERDEREDE